MKKVAVLQSNYIPWKGYFDIIHDVDEFIFHDDVQCRRRRSLLYLGLERAFALKYIFWLQLLLLFGSVGGVCAKYAAAHPFFGTEFCVAYAALLITLVVYAVGWQQIIKHLPLTTAYASKSTGIIYAVFWGVLVFDETVSLGKIVGIVITVCGVVLFADSEDL